MIKLKMLALTTYKIFFSLVRCLFDKLKFINSFPCKFDNIDKYSEKQLKISHNTITNSSVKSNNESEIFEINNCFVFGRYGYMFNERYIINPGDYVRSEYLDIYNHKVPVLVSSDQKNIDVAVVLAIKNPNNYYHWILDFVIKLYDVEISQLGREIVTNKPTKKFQKEFIDSFRYKFNFHYTSNDRKLKISKAKTILLNKGELDYQKRGNYLYDELLKNDNENFKYKLLYIPRLNHVNSRRVINEKEVKDILFQFGFKEIILENHSIQEQAKIFRNAEIVVAPHGAGLTNIIFSMNLKYLIEFIHENHYSEAFRVICQNKGVGHDYIFGINETNLPDPDLIVNINDLKIKLSNIFNLDFISK